MSKGGQFLREYKLVVVGGGGKVLILYNLSEPVLNIYENGYAMKNGGIWVNWDCFAGMVMCGFCN